MHCIETICVCIQHTRHVLVPLQTLSSNSIATASATASSTHHSRQPPPPLLPSPLTAAPGMSSNSRPSSAMQSPAYVPLTLRWVCHISATSAQGTG